MVGSMHPLPGALHVKEGDGVGERVGETEAPKEGLADGVEVGEGVMLGDGLGATQMLAPPTPCS